MLVDRVVKQIQAQSGDEKDLKTLYQWLTKQEQAIVKHGSRIDAALEALDAHEHSMGMTFLLSVKCVTNDIADPEAFLQHCERLFAQSNHDQVQMVAKRFVEVGFKYADVATMNQVPKRAVLPLRASLQRLQTSEHHLTALHSAFMQVCLSAKTYSVAARVADVPMYTIGGDPDVKKRSGFTSLDFLCYYYYAGLVYTGLKRWDRAMQCYEAAFTAPAVVLSAVMLHAYKKHILVSLIAQGRHDPSRPPSPMISRHLRALTVPYTDLVNAFQTKSSIELATVLERHGEVYQRDGNLGLVKQCRESLVDRSIRDFTETYITLSLANMVEGAHLADVADARCRLLRMIDAGQIYARIDHKEGMVSFFEKAANYDTSADLAFMDERIRRVIELGYKLRQQDEEIAESAPYVQRTSMREGRFGDDAMMMMAGMAGMGMDPMMMFRG